MANQTITGVTPTGQVVPVQVDSSGVVATSGGGGGGGGGAVTLADGASTTLGAKADAAITNPALSASEISLLKGIISQLQAGVPVTSSSFSSLSNLSSLVADSSPASQNITIVDSLSTITPGANSQSIITGTPSPSSSALFPITGIETAMCQVSGTWTGTLQLEVSFDGGTTFYPRGLHQAGTNYTASTFTANFGGGCNTGGCTHIRVRATIAITGTATVKVSLSQNPNSIYVSNNPKLADGTTPSTTATVKAASTPPSTTDTSLVISSADGNFPSIGAKADSASADDNTTPASIISLFRRSLQRWTTLFSLIPAALGPTLQAASFPILLPRKTSITGTVVSTTTTNANLLDGSGSAAATDVRDQQSGLVIVVSSATTGSYTMQGAFDSAFTIGVKTLIVSEPDVTNVTPTSAAITPTNTTRNFAVSLVGINYIRVNLTVGPTSGSIQAYAVLNQSPIPTSTIVTPLQTSAANNVVTLGGATTSTASNSLTNHKLVSAATTNATSVKASSGKVATIELENTSAAAKYFHLYNKASAPTVGTDVPIKTYLIPANSYRNIDYDIYTCQLTTGIAYSITLLSPDTDATAIAAGDVIVNMMFI